AERLHSAQPHPAARRTMSVCPPAARFLLAAFAAAALSAQDEGSLSSRRDLSKLRGIELRYPRDKDRPVASVDGRELTLGDLVRHMTERHAPEFDAFLSTPAGNLYFQERLPADWVRQFADVVALRAEARYREVPAERLERKLAEAAEQGFNAWLEEFERKRRDQGVTAALSEERKASLRARHARESGLALERQGLLDALTPDLDNIGLDAAHWFHREYPRYFGGVVHLAHILVYDRHPVTGQLLVEEDRAKAQALVAEIKARLNPDGSNFEEVARLMSEDRRSGQRGGVLRNVSRFDSRLPPSVTRAAWDMADGEWRGPIESSFGQHFVKRISYTHYAFFLITETTLPKVRTVMRQKLQEDAMLEIRERHRVQLLF
ncbi:MAG TPA: peptidylprolyl isomerase, partial [Planctomycetota bacterium]|nr:peptidylprolyl isomerase [Planctomycetota bacterium]